MRTRNNRIQCWLNDKEAESFEKHVKKSGLSRESYIRMLLAGHVPRTAPPLEYHQLIHELNTIGNRMTQIAARADATGFFLADEYQKNVRELSQTLLNIQAALTLPERMTG